MKDSKKFFRIKYSFISNIGLVLCKFPHALWEIGAFFQGDASTIEGALEFKDTTWPELQMVLEVPKSHTLPLAWQKKIQLLAADFPALWEGATKIANPLHPHTKHNQCIRREIGLQVLSTFLAYLHTHHRNLVPKGTYAILTFTAPCYDDDFLEETHPYPPHIAPSVMKKLQESAHAYLTKRHVLFDCAFPGCNDYLITKGTGYTCCGNILSAFAKKHIDPTLKLHLASCHFISLGTLLRTIRAYHQDTQTMEEALAIEKYAIIREDLEKGLQLEVSKTLVRHRK